MSDPASGIAERIVTANSTRATLRIAGAGTWLDAGAPCTADTTLSLASASGVMEYEPGDLTITAGAGTPLSDIARICGAEGQWLTLDPRGHPDMTLGAVVATGSWGPLAHAFGTPRDHVLGCEFVTGAGDVVRAGGRVVKNVAGFDLVRLVTGAWGTLGAITEVTVRLRALPEIDETFALPLSGSLDAVDQAWRWLRNSEFVPFAAELLSASLATTLGIGTSAMLLVRFGGNRSFVRAAGHALQSLGMMNSVQANVWSALQAVDESESASLRLSALPSRIGHLWSRAAETAERGGGHAHATLSRGVVRCVVPGTSTQPLRELVAMGLENDATCIGERMPQDAWSALHRRRDTEVLTTRVKTAFDPARVLNPGILGGAA